MKREYRFKTMIEIMQEMERRRRQFWQRFAVLFGLIGFLMLLFEFGKN